MKPHHPLVTWWRVPLRNVMRNGWRWLDTMTVPEAAARHQDAEQFKESLRQAVAPGLKVNMTDLTLKRLWQLDNSAAPSEHDPSMSESERLELVAKYYWLGMSKEQVRELVEACGVEFLDPKCLPSTIRKYFDIYPEGALDAIREELGECAAKGQLDRSRQLIEGLGLTWIDPRGTCTTPDQN